MAKQDKLNRVSTLIPLLWQNWRSSANVASMPFTQRGFYLEMLIDQWIYGDLPCDAWKLHKQCGSRSDFRTTVKWLDKYSALLVCTQHSNSRSTATCDCFNSGSTADRES